MIAFAVIMTRRADLTEGMAYLSDDYHEASGMARVLLDNSAGKYLRARVKKMTVSHRQAAGFWAKQGQLDARNTVACPLVPKRFAAVYRKHFDAARKEAAKG